MRWRGTVAYDGTDFFGWQSQPGGNTVQDVLEARLAEILGSPTRIHGSGRTDSGVHARGQVFHFDAEWRHGSEAMLQAIRGGVPESILLRTLTRAPARFHARYSATGKRYSYRIYAGYALPAEVRDAWSVQRRKVNIEAMREAAGRLVGKHDFSAFAALRGTDDGETPVKDLRRLDVSRRGSRITITTEASGYLYKMVRSLAGALVEVGFGKLTPDDITVILESRTRPASIITAPPRGLSLERVFYT